MATGKSTLRHFKKIYPGMTSSLILILAVLMIISGSQAGVVKGKVNSIHGNTMELDLGAEKGIRLGDLGKVYYNILVDGKDRPIFIARFKITHVSENSSIAQIQEKTGEVKVGYGVEIVFKGGELEVVSEPSGAKVYMDGREVGETPALLSDVGLGEHLIRIVKEGHEAYEEQAKVTGGARKKIFVSLKRTVGALTVITEPPGANIFIDGKSVGVSPYEGKALPPGTCRVKVFKEGYETWERDVAIEVGKRVEIVTKLEEKRKEVATISTPTKSELPKGKETKVPEVPKVPKEVDLAKKSCEAPVWKIGDKWTYQNVSRVVFTIEVVDTKESLFILKIPRIENLLAYDKKTMNCLFLIGKDGKKVNNTDDPFKNLFNFPIFVGKKWAYTTSTSWGSYNKLNEFKIEGIEEVVTPAGKFMAYKIFNQQRILQVQAVALRGGPTEGWVRYWYSPEVKTWVKREVEKSAYWVRETWLQDTELISYKLK